MGRRGSVMLATFYHRHASVRESTGDAFVDGDIIPVSPRVTGHIDTYPGLVLRGHVASIQSGTGSRFSVLPAENASGNFVKIVQRVPVKIVVDEPADPRYRSDPACRSCRSSG